MKHDANAAVWVSFAADSLALAAHWIYDTDMIAARFGRIEALGSPGSDSYHAGRQAGMFTHYGDQALWLAESVAAKNGFDLAHFARTWRKGFAEYDGYYDRATKTTLENFARGLAPEESGSLSTDLAGAARIAPLVRRYRSEPATLFAAARAQTAMTHKNPAVTDAAVFFADAALSVLAGQKPAEALADAAQKGSTDPRIKAWVSAGLESASRDSIAAIKSFGQTCDISGAFPSVIHLIARHQDDPAEGLIQNVLAGGDSAARGLIAGMIFGAHKGMDAVFPEWIAGLKAQPWIASLLDRMG